MSKNSKVAQFSMIVIISLGLTACGSPKKKYQWQTKNGQVASNTKVKAVKRQCRYDKRLEKAANHILTALIVNKKTVRKVADKRLLKRADKTLASLKGCMKTKGLKRVKS